LAFGTFSPLRSLSAPTALPLPGHPYLGANNMQDEKVKARKQQTINRVKRLRNFIGFDFKVTFKLTNFKWFMQAITAPDPVKLIHLLP
jgi:hypothetical protein